MGQNVLLAMICLVSVIVSWKGFLAFEGTEFGSGSLAGNKDIGGLLYIVALILTFKFPRVAAVCGLIACCASLPLYLYLVFPRPFREVWPGEWKVLGLPRETFIWNELWVTGIVFNILAAGICGLRLLRALPIHRHR